MAKKKTRLNSGGKLRRHRPYTGYGERIAALGTQSEVARVLGVAQQTVSKKLQGECAIALSELEKLAKHYDMPLTYFFEDGTIDSELARVEKRVRADPGPLRDLAALACSLSRKDHERLIAVAKVLVLRDAGR